MNFIELSVRQRPERDRQVGRPCPGRAPCPGIAIQVIASAVSVTGVPPWIVVSGVLSFCGSICGAQSSTDSG